MRREEKPEDRAAGREIARLIGPLIDRKAREIFAEYKELLLCEPASHIIPAIWGIQTRGEPSSAQKEIREKVAPVLKEVFARLDTPGSGASNHDAISFLVRNLIVSKILFAMERFKNQLLMKVISGEDEFDLLEEDDRFGALH